MADSRKLLGIDVDLPVGTCDCHFHYLEREEQLLTLPNFRAYEDHSPKSILARQIEVGIQYGVLARRAGQSTEAFLKALAASDGRWHGLMHLVEVPSSDEMQRLHGAGVRGCRFTLIDYSTNPIHRPPNIAEEMILRIADKVWAKGWHIAFHVEGPGLIEREAFFRKLRGGNVVIDHMARTKPQGGLEQPSFLLLLDLLRQGNIWVRVSALDNHSIDGPPKFADVIPFGKAAVDSAPERTLWASDSPWTFYRNGSRPPAIAELLRLAWAYCGGDETKWRNVMALNSARLFGFPIQREQTLHRDQT